MNVLVFRLRQSAEDTTRRVLEAGNEEPRDQSAHTPVLVNEDRNEKKNQKKKNLPPAIEAEEAAKARSSFTTTRKTA